MSKVDLLRHVLENLGLVGNLSDLTNAILAVPVAILGLSDRSRIWLADFHLRGSYGVDLASIINVTESGA